MTQCAVCVSQVCFGGALHAVPQSVLLLQPQRKSLEVGSVTHAVPALEGQPTQSTQVPDDPHADCWFPLVHCPAPSQQ